MKLYIKGYYGYKNFGDELLLLGLINYFVDIYKPEYIYIESGNKIFLQDWINKNQKYINFDINKIQVVTKKEYIYKYYKFRNCHKIIGGGECISPVAKFPNGGRKYILRFWLDIIRSNYAICGGIGTPNESSKKLYKLLLGNAKQVIVRDPESQKISLIYNPNTVLYHDFAVDVIDIYQTKRLKIEEAKIDDKYILLNLKDSEYKAENIELIKSFIAKYPDHKLIYFANFIGEDDGLFDKLNEELGGGLEYRNRVDKNLDEILDLFENSVGGRGVRLHFLMILKLLGKDYEYIHYQEKIKKLIG